MLLTPFYQTLLDELNYVSLTLLMAMESSVLPVPSELVVPPAAYMAAEGRMDVWLVLFFSTLGCVIGASVNYTVSMIVGRPVIYGFARTKVGKLLLHGEEGLTKAENYFCKRGEIATLMGRLLPVVRHLISIPAGLSRMNYLRFCLFTAIGSAIWNGILTLLGWYLHSLVSLSELNEKVSEYERPILFAIVLIAVLMVLYFVYKGLHKRK